MTNQSAPAVRKTNLRVRRKVIGLVRANIDLMQCGKAP